MIIETAEEPEDMDTEHVNIHSLTGGLYVHKTEMRMEFVWLFDSQFNRNEKIDASIDEGVNWVREVHLNTGKYERFGIHPKNICNYSLVTDPQILSWGREMFEQWIEDKKADVEKNEDLICRANIHLMDK